MRWLRRFARRPTASALAVRALPRWWVARLWQAGTATAAGDVLAVLGALHRRVRRRWPLVAGLSPGRLAARCDGAGCSPLLAARARSSPPTSGQRICG